MTGFPWYDSPWLATYVRAKAWMAHMHPARLAEFEARLAPLRTDPAFEVKSIPQLFDEDRLQKIRNAIRDLKPAQLELHEACQFGRFIVHDHPYFTELQRDLVEAVGEAVGERVEPSYNFLSLYSKAGVCGVHLDAPSAKWTLDSYCLTPGSALAFSGSSQWHYRDPLPRAAGAGHFSNLLFFHFIPRGTAEIVEPRNCPTLFGLPGLAEVTNRHEAAGTVKP